MIKRVEDIMITDFAVVSVIDGVEKVINLSLATKQEYFPVLDNGVIAGVISYKELMAAHPNRIIADTGINRYAAVSPKDSIWMARDVITENDADILLVIDQGCLVGLLKKADLLIEISKYFDPLTGLYRSSYLYFYAEKLIKNGRELSVIFIDVNNFGQINKLYGHVKGNVVLTVLAQILKESILPNMYLCRYGGDEFAVLTACGAAECERFSTHLQSKISSKAYPSGIDVSIAVGIAGGRRRKAQLEANAVSIISNLVNLASLASTQAKKKASKLHIEQYVDIESIA